MRLPSRLSRLVSAIAPPDDAAGEAIQRHLDSLTKPPGSLGRLEEIAGRLAMVRGGPPSVARPVIFTFAADHGVVAEGVSAYPQSVTAQMVENFLRGGAAVNVLARDAGVRIVVADFGMAHPVPRSASLIDCRLGAGTANIAHGPAMTRDQAMRSLDAGARLAEEAIAEGADLLGTGEMGIGNTTVAGHQAAITGVPAEAVTGAAERDRRDRVAAQGRGGPARARAEPPRPVGCRGRARQGGWVRDRRSGRRHPRGRRAPRPIAMDGFIATAAALIAVTLAAAARGVLFGSHRSAEPGHAHALAHLGLTPYLDLAMRLGEGTGAALFVHLARAAARIYTAMATFKSAGVDGPR